MIVCAACGAILNFFLFDELQVWLVTYEWSESRRLADNFIPGTLREFVYIRDCTWARPTMRACTELFILAREREWERTKATTLSFASLSSFLSLFFAAYSTYSTLFFLARRSRDPCIPRLPSVFFSLFPSAHADRHSTKKWQMKKITSVLTFCNLHVSHCRVDKSTAESCVLLEKSCSTIIPFWTYRECDKLN